MLARDKRIRGWLQTLYTQLMDYQATCIEMLTWFPMKSEVKKLKESKKLNNLNSIMMNTAYQVLIFEEVFIGADYIILKWILSEFGNSVKSNIDIYINRLEICDDNLNKEQEKRNTRQQELVKEILFDSSIKLHDGAILSAENGMFNIKREDEHELYCVKETPLFKDSINPVSQKNSIAYHGTSLGNAKRIIKDKQFKGDQGYTAHNLYNKGKVFFSPSLDGAEYYINNAGDTKRSESIIFEVDLNNNDFYQREHLLVDRKEMIIYFAKEGVATDIIKSIYLIDNGSKTRLITTEELLGLDTKKGK